MIGHSVGEMGAGYADNGLTREQMILAAYSRGKASLETPVIKGMMAAIGKSLYYFRKVSKNFYILCTETFKRYCFYSKIFQVKDIMK